MYKGLVTYCQENLRISVTLHLFYCTCRWMNQTTYTKKDTYWSTRREKHSSRRVKSSEKKMACRLVSTGVLVSPQSDQDGNKLMFLSERREFPSAPCLAGKTTWYQLASRCCWNRARPWHASELVSFLFGLKTYQHAGSYRHFEG